MRFLGLVTSFLPSIAFAEKRAPWQEFGGTAFVKTHVASISDWPTVTPNNTLANSTSLGSAWEPSTTSSSEDPSGSSSSAYISSSFQLTLNETTPTGIRPSPTMPTSSALTASSELSTAPRTSKTKFTTASTSELPLVTLDGDELRVEVTETVDGVTDNTLHTMTGDDGGATVVPILFGAACLIFCSNVAPGGGPGAIILGGVPPIPGTYVLPPIAGVTPAPGAVIVNGGAPTPVPKEDLESPDNGDDEDDGDISTTKASRSDSSTATETSQTGEETVSFEVTTIVITEEGQSPSPTPTTVQTSETGEETVSFEVTTIVITEPGQSPSPTPTTFQTSDTAEETVSSEITTIVITEPGQSPSPTPTTLQTSDTAEETVSFEITTIVVTEPGLNQTISATQASETGEETVSFELTTIVVTEPGLSQTITTPQTSETGAETVSFEVTTIVVTEPGQSTDITPTSTRTPEESTTTEVSETKTTEEPETTTSEVPTTTMSEAPRFTGDEQDCYYHHERAVEENCFFWICEVVLDSDLHSIDLVEDPENFDDSPFFEDIGYLLEHRKWGRGEIGLQESFAMDWPSAENSECKCKINGAEVIGETYTFEDGDGGFSWKRSGSFCQCSFQCHPT